VPFLPAITGRLAEALGVEGARVSVKGKTNEGVGEIGRGEAIAAHAVALLRVVVGSRQ
jgi:2C-methyl-D-erythritol 2,4-cyclodiphosphate synthase